MSVIENCVDFVDAKQKLDNHSMNIAYVRDFRVNVVLMNRSMDLAANVLMLNVDLYEDFLIVHCLLMN